MGDKARNPVVDAEVILDVQDLSVDYSDVEVVRGVDLCIRAGEKVGIVGESGSGKSTVALALLRLLPDNGNISKGVLHVGGRDTSAISERELNQVRGRGIALVSQDPLSALDPVKTIGYQLREAILQKEPRLSKRELDERSIQLLTQVGVPDAKEKLRQYPHQYSGGMRQRVCIAMAIALEPKLLIADEPTTALDVTTQAQVLELLEELVTTTDISVLLISHDLGVVSTFCDRVLVMYAGRVVESASAEDLFKNPQHPYTKGLIGSLPSRHTDRSKPLPYIAGSPPPMDTVGVGCSFAPRCPLATQTCRSKSPVPVSISDQPVHWAECHYVEEVGVGND